MTLPALDARARALRRVHADRPLGDARDARRGLHPHRAGEGAEAVGDRAQARAAERDAADHDARSRSRSATSSPGAILVETVFSWPGIGRAVYQAVLAARLPDAAGRVPRADALGRRSSTSSPTSSTSSSTRGSPSERRSLHEPGARRRPPGAPLARRTALGRDQAAAVGDDRRDHARRVHRAGGARAVARALRAARAGRAGLRAALVGAPARARRRRHRHGRRC